MVSPPDRIEAPDLWSQILPGQTGAVPKLFRMATAYWVSQAIYVAAKLGLADALSERPKSIGEIATELRADSNSFARLVRVLVDLGVFAVESDGRIRLTVVGGPLQSGVPGSLHSMILTLGQEHYQAWGRLVESIQSGRPGFNDQFGSPLFEYLKSNPPASQTFNQAMDDFTSQVALAVNLAYDFSGIRTLADVGGGHGVLLGKILKSNPSMLGILFDSSHVIEGAMRHIESERLGGRCETVAGSFLESVPRGADAYVLKNVLHDWDDEHAVIILKNCHQAMREGSRLLVLEVVLPLLEDRSLGGLLDLNMLVMSGGRERTREDYHKLFDESGFRLTQVIPTMALVSIIEALPLK
jgi:hypothetical protein